MRQNPVGERAATAAWNFGTPRQRSSLKRLCPFRHCRQRYERNLRRIHASRFVSTTRGLAEAEVAAPSDEVWPQFFDQLLQHSLQPGMNSRTPSRYFRLQNRGAVIQALPAAS
jgi:hypothetical protein